MGNIPSRGKSASDNNSKPVVAITIGDPAGIGPEVVLKALAHSPIYDVCVPIVIGDRSILSKTSKLLHLSSGHPRDLIDLKNVSETVRPGYESAETGKASAEYIESAVDLWRKGKVDAIATAPISKNALALAGISYPGHTEMLAALTNTQRFAMSFFAGELRVVLLSTHVSLLDAIARVSTENIVDLIEFSDRQLSSLLGRPVTLAVAGLNPHASEGGLFGREEIDAIMPAVAKCKGSGIDVSGPYSPDTIFLRGFRGEFDGVLACYHDQATIAVKSLSFGSAVNVTLGLPLIRTSVDHGTAFDIAGSGKGDPSSMIAAIELAATLAARTEHRRANS